MKTKLLLLFTVLFFTISGVLSGQEPNRSLVITEWRGDNAHSAYLELTNMGDTELDLSEFTVGRMIGSSLTGLHSDNFKRLEGTLAPGQTYMIASIAEGSNDNVAPGYPMIYPRISEKADLLVYIEELDRRMIAAGLTPEDDSVSWGFQLLLRHQRGEYGQFLFHHPTDEDSVIVDGVGLVFHPETGALMFNQFKDVAGVFNASETHILVRKFSVKEGNPDWQVSRGATPEESEWMPVPFRTGYYERFSGEYTLAGNHGVYSINDNSVKPKPDVPMDIDFTNRVISVPWGTLRDTISLTPWEMIDFGDGLAWWYDLNEVRGDSVHAICQSGDILTLYAVGNELQKIDFNINVVPPTDDMNQIFPLRTINALGFYTENQYYFVTQNDPVIDSILNVPFALRVDTLLKRLEIAPGASWEIEWVDGNQRPDVKFGDKIVVRAANNSIKEYFIAVNDYLPSTNPYLGAITWPEIPEYLKGGAGWRGDTIPNFLSNSYILEVTVPYGVNKIPALVAHTQNTNARVVEQRATSLTGGVNDRTTVFKVYAENDSVFQEYRVIFNKEINPFFIQPFNTDPFISQVLRQLVHENNWVELFNPGNQDIDLSRYMLSYGPAGASPAAVIQSEPSFDNRYIKYVPGRKYSDDPDVYAIDKTLRTDLSVDPILKPNSTWVFGTFIQGGRENRRVPALEAITDFHLSPTVPNIWGITYEGQSMTSLFVRNRWPLYLFRIENDSVINGTKMPNDPTDFSLIDIFGRFPNEDGVWFDPHGTAFSGAGFTATRKPTVWQGNPESGGSFGANAEESEWKDVRWNGLYDPSQTSLSLWEWCSEGLGTHFIDPISDYKSTISSLTYLVSDGYTDGQTIIGIEAQTTVDQLFANIIKNNEGQELTVKSTADGSVKSGAELLSNSDTLVVTSADMSNQTRYILTVGAPLDNNAVITSGVYLVSIDGSTGTIAGMDYGTAISSVLSNITVPPTAVLNIINKHNALVPLKKLNSDTVLVQTQVHQDIYFEVVAQNGTTKITYRMIPESGADDAFVVSDVYEVNQDLFFINFINNNTAVPKLLENLIPVMGASMRVLDKYGFEREKGFLAYDDMLEVTSQSGNVKNFYFLGFKAELGLLRNDAYVVSSVYTVNQPGLTITGVGAGVSVVDFKADITPAAGASFIVTDGNDVELSAGNMSDGYKVKVTSEDGLKVTTYQVFDELVGITTPEARKITLYPNPTKDILYVDGLVQGDYIRVYNLVGVMVKMLPFEQINGYISLEHLKPGMYFIEVSSRESAPQTFKVYKQQF